MRIHHLNCATLCPIGGAAMFGNSHMVCHCLLIETERGLVLVDTALGRDDVAQRHRRLGRGFIALMRPRFDPEETAAAQIARLGFSTDDVRHVVLTHLDLDHAGAIADFPRARIHVLEVEREAAMARRTLNERLRYLPAQWAHGPEWAPHAVRGERWMGFECVAPIDDLPPEILLVPLPGHTRGHAGIAVRRPDRWLLHCGDAYFHHTEMDPSGRRCPRGLDWFQRFMQIDGPARMKNQERLRALARDATAEVTVFCAHDPADLERLARPEAARA